HVGQRRQRFGLVLIDLLLQLLFQFFLFFERLVSVQLLFLFFRLLLLFFLRLLFLFRRLSEVAVEELLRHLPGRLQAGQVHPHQPALLGTQTVGRVQDRLQRALQRRALRRVRRERVGVGDVDEGHALGLPQCPQVRRW